MLNTENLKVLKQVLSRMLECCLQPSVISWLMTGGFVFLVGVEAVSLISSQGSKWLISSQILAQDR